MKLILDVPQPVFKKMTVAAAREGLALERWVNGAIEQKLARDFVAVPRWRAGFGQLRHLREETRRIQKLIDREFSRVDPEE